MEQQKRLPFIVTSFSKIIKDNRIYVDKTDMIAELAQDGGLISYLDQDALASQLW